MRLLTVLLGFAIAVAMVSGVEIFLRVENGRMLGRSLRPFASFFQEEAVPSDGRQAELLRGIDLHELEKVPDPFADLRARHAGEDFSEISGTYYAEETESGYISRFVRPDGEVVYNQPIDFDSNGRRILRGVPAVKKPDSTILTVGCSFTLGEGLAAENTVAAFLQKAIIREKRRTRVEITARSGWGAGNHLYALRFRDDARVASPYRNLPQNKTIAVYLFIDSHIDRGQCPLSCYASENEWLLESPEFEVMPDGRVEFRGKFKETRAAWIPWLRPIADSAIVRRFNLEWPTLEAPSGMPRFIATLESFKSELSELVPLEDFYVVLYHEYPYRIGQAVANALKGKGIKIIDLRALDTYDIMGEREAIPFEGHPSPQKNWLIAQFVLKRIREDHPNFGRLSRF